jgi:hypothetical protein
VVQIRSVEIKNFRCLRHVNIEFDSVTTLIGPNGGVPCRARAFRPPRRGPYRGAPTASAGGGEGQLEIKMVFEPDTTVHHLTVRRTVSGTGTRGGCCST